MPTPAVITAPDSTAYLKQGFDTLANLIALTLGPARGNVLNTTELNQLELVHDAATIARRITALPDRRQDVGAMLLRNLVWRVSQQVGDGGATAAVLAQAILDRAHRYVSAGANAMMIQRGVKMAVDVALDELTKRAQAVNTEDDLIAVANAVSGDDTLSLILGEMFHLLGARAHITIEEHVAPYLERTYIDGGKWEAQLTSPYFANTVANRGAVLHDCTVALFDGEILFNDDVMPLLELITKREPKHLLLLVKDITDEAFNLVVTNHGRNNMKIIVARSKRIGQEMENDFNDLALLSGAHYFSKEMRVTMKGIAEKHLGRSRRVEVVENSMFVVGGGGSPTSMRDKIAEMEEQLALSDLTKEERAEIGLRLARLSGSSAVLHIGATTETERKMLQQKAEQGIKALRSVAEEGVLPGGGIAYINCLPALKKIKTDQEDVALGVKVVAHALEAPFRTILANAGMQTPGVVLEEIKRKGSSHVYDVMKHCVVDSTTSKMYDSAKVLRTALQIAASGANIALTTETMVLKSNPETAYEP
ncbi:MAG: hypothetical protein HZB17_10855 [Chloroflexi bacterium]|nr:hypothetical protein [Chloroflexota bacterium]